MNASSELIGTQAIRKAGKKEEVLGDSKEEMTSELNKTQKDLARDKCTTTITEIGLKGDRETNEKEREKEESSETKTVTIAGKNESMEENLKEGVEKGNVGARMMDTDLDSAMYINSKLYEISILKKGPRE